MTVYPSSGGRPSLFLASRNPGKISDFSSFMPGVELLSPLSLAFPESLDPEESGSSFRENAALKAVFWSEKTGHPCLGDDAGFCIEALGGGPGVQTRRFAESLGGYEAMFRFLEEHPGIRANRRVRCVTALALACPGEPVRFYEAVCEGQLALPARGSGGYGFDPVFVPDGAHQTYAEMRAEDREAFSPRTRAFGLFREANPFLTP